MEHINFQMVLYMKVRLKIINLMDKGNCNLIYCSTYTWNDGRKYEGEWLND